VRWGIIAVGLAAFSDRDRCVDFENSLFLVFRRHFRVGEQTAEEGHRCRQAHGPGLFDHQLGYVEGSPRRSRKLTTHKPAGRDAG
jgi:hypothetical protein